MISTEVILKLWQKYLQWHAIWNLVTTTKSADDIETSFLLAFLFSNFNEQFKKNYWNEKEEEVIFGIFLKYYQTFFLANLDVSYDLKEAGHSFQHFPNSYTNRMNTTNV